MTQRRFRWLGAVLSLGALLTPAPTMPAQATTGCTRADLKDKAGADTPLTGVKLIPAAGTVPE